MTSRDLRVELHKNHYDEDGLQSIGDSIINGLDCTGSCVVRPSSSHIELKLETTTPSELNLSAAVDQSLQKYISNIGMECDSMVNMYNILISSVNDDRSIVTIML